MTFLEPSVPRAFAHRGWHTGDLDGCENTLAAFRRAISEGFAYLELDVRVTSDGELVVFHDAELDRVTDAGGPLAARRHADLADVRVAGREPIPTLADVLEHCPGARINIDPKCDEAVGPLLDVLADSHAYERVCVTSFSQRRLATIRQATPRTLTTTAGPWQVRELVARSAIGLAGRPLPAAAAQVPPVSGVIPVITERFITTAHRGGLEVHAWTIDDAAEMRSLLDMGVDGIMTDRPDVLRSVLADRGQWV